MMNVEHMGIRTIYVSILLVLVHLGSSLECLDFLFNVSLPLLASESWSSVFFGLGLPVFRLLCWFERRVFADSGVCIRVDLLNVFRANTVRKVGGELLLESESKHYLELTVGNNGKTGAYRSSSSSSKLSMYSAT
jgi:hypothetical protein